MAKQYWISIVCTGCILMILQHWRAYLSLSKKHSKWRHELFIKIVITIKNLLKCDMVKSYNTYKYLNNKKNIFFIIQCAHGAWQIRSVECHSLVCINYCVYKINYCVYDLIFLYQDTLFIFSSMHLISDSISKPYLVYFKLYLINI